MGRRLGHVLGMCLVAVVSALSSIGQCANIAVLYPDVREPYLTVFLTILQGIEARASGSVKRSALREDYDPDEVRAWLREENADILIALGQRGLQAAQQVHGELPVVTGALLLTPKLNGYRFHGISLAADPDRLFTQLRSLAPRVQRVYVIYNREQNAWLLDLARQSARAHGLDLRAYEAQDLRGAVQRYRDILGEAQPERDALWLPPDATTVDDRTVLPMVLEAAWDKRLVVFSSNPAHAQRGALFALYPDNLALGRSLVDLALALKRGQQDSVNVLPLSDLRVAVNLRTAAHLGLSLSSGQQRGFDLVFPSP